MARMTFVIVSDDNANDEFDLETVVIRLNSIKADLPNAELFVSVEDSAQQIIDVIKPV